MSWMRTWRILVVDDSPFALQWCRSMLGAYGMEVSTLDDPLLILKRVREFSPDAVVLDVNMPGIDADAVADIVHKRRALDVPIVLHSELPAEQLEPLAARFGAAWVCKSPAPDCLIDTLVELIRTHRPLHVVAVDDDSQALRALSRAFRAHAGRRVKVTTTNSPEEALALAVKEPPDALLVDVYMPGVDGVGVLRKARALEDLRGVRLLAMSAAPRHQCPGDLMVNGAHAFLSKPIAPDQVLSLLAARPVRFGGRSPVRTAGQARGISGAGAERSL